MKKMKRVLSLALAMVMLLGMVMVPTGAVSTFTDADMIENTEAVAITSGIGLFAGTTDGQFAPKAAVTRAQMATIIVKMLRGSDFNADSFKGVGVNPFPDTAAFESGWAEGYINACYQMGAVAGYGDGTFQPGKYLTTAEALTMIINALGVDPGPGDWPTNYMAKAEELKLYGDLATKPGTNAPLTRDQLAVIVWEGLQYSTEDQTGWRIPNHDMVFERYTDALKANGGNTEGITAVLGQDSLASKVYEIETATGWIIGNQASGKKCTVLSDGSRYNVETDVNMLGHYVTVYYKEPYTSDKQPGEAYAVVDESTVVTVTETIKTAKDYKAAFLTSRCDVAETGYVFDAAYVGTYHDGKDNLGKPDDSDKLSVVLADAPYNYVAGSNAPAGTYIIVEGEIVAYIAPVPVYASWISGFGMVDGEETVYIGGITSSIPNAKDNDRVVEYEGMATGDFVTYSMIGSGDDAIYVLSPVEKITGVITKSSKTEIGDDVYETIVINGEEYPAFEKKNDTSRNQVVSSNRLDYKVSKLQYDQTYTLYVTEKGRYIGFELVDSATSLDDTVYLLGTITTQSYDQNYGTWYQYNKARGVDMDGNEVLIPLGKRTLSGKGGAPVADTEVGSWNGVTEGFYTVADSTESEEKKEGIQVLTAYSGKAGNENATYVTIAYATGNFSGSGELWTIDGLPAKTQGTTRYLQLVVDKDPTEPLTVEATTGTMPTVEMTRGNATLLVTNNGKQLNLVAFVLKQEEITRDTMWVYVSDEQFKNQSMALDGKLYEAYECRTGNEIEVVVAAGEAQIEGAGFAELEEIEAETGIYKTIQYATETDHTTLPSKTESQDKSIGFYNLGYYNVVDNDRLRFERMEAIDGTRTAIDGIVDPRLETQGMANAKVYDLRDDEEIRDSRVAEITSAKQLLALCEADPGLMVVFDMAMHGDYRDYDITALFIKKVMRGTVGMGSIIYAESFGTDDGGDYAEGFAVSTASDDLGEGVKVYADYIRPAGEGFYRYTVTADGYIVLLPFDEDVTSVQTYGMVGLHQTIEELKVGAGGTLMKTVSTADADAAHVDDCAYICDNTTFEALTDVYLTKGTLVYDARYNVWLEVSDLTDGLNVDYFCAQGVSSYDIDEAGKDKAKFEALKDDVAKLVVITGEAGDSDDSGELEEEIVQIALNGSDSALKPNPPAETVEGPTCSGTHGTGWTVLPNQNDVPISEDGYYYLNNSSFLGKIVVDGDIEVTICMNGCNNERSWDRLEVKGGATVNLVNCKTSGGLIHRTSGGGAAVKVSSGTLNMGENVTIKTGGTVFAVQVDGASSVFNMNGGTVTGNDAPSGAIRALNNGVVNVNGGAISNGTNDVVSVQTGGTVSVKGGKFSKEPGAAHVASGYTVGTNTGADKTTYPYVVQRANREEHSCTAVTGAGTMWNVLKSGTTINASGYYCLGDDVTDKITVEVTDPVVLCLCGHSIENNGGTALEIKKGTVTVVNCSETVGEIKNTATGTGQRAIQVGNGTDTAKLTINYGVSVSGSTNVEEPVFLNKGTFVMKAGSSITGNTGTTYGGVFIHNGSTFTMEGGEISGNKAADAGGVRVYKGTFDMNGGKITDNTVSKDDGGSAVKLEETGAMTMDGGTISGSGNVIRKQSSRAVTLSGGTITGNIYIFPKATGTVTMEDTLKVNGGTTCDGGTLNITGGTFTGDVKVRNNGVGAISGGSFAGTVATETSDGKVGSLTITGGEFAKNPEAYLGSGYKCVFDKTAPKYIFKVEEL